MDIIEIWKDIDGYEGKYQISNYGRLKSIKKDLIMKPMIATNGYLVACLWKDNKQRKFRKGKVNPIPPQGIIGLYEKGIYR